MDATSKKLEEIETKLKELKIKYDKIRVKNYSEALEFWEQNIIPLYRNHPVSFLSNRLVLNIMLDRPTPKNQTEESVQNFFRPESKDDFLTALPNEEDEQENETFNRWFFRYYSENFVNIEKAKEIVQGILEKSPDGKAYLIKEKNDLENELNLLDIEIKHSRVHDLERGRKKIIKESIIRGEEPNWRKDSYSAIRNYIEIKLKVELLVYIRGLIEAWDTPRVTKTKMKWNGTPSMLGFLITELANKGFIEYPLRSGEINYTGLANIAFEIFEVNTTIQNLAKEFNPNKNTFSDTKQSKFVIPELIDLK